MEMQELITQIEGFKKHIGIAGFRDVRIENVNSFLDHIREMTRGVSVQLFRADLIAGHEHLFFASVNALKAFESNLNISRSLAVETLLYASAQRQIRKALELLGITANSSKVAILVLARTGEEIQHIFESISKFIQGVRDDRIVQFSDEKIGGIMELFNISRLELEAKLEQKGSRKEALVDLVIEHMALVAIGH